jgi:ribosome-associated translation inhibitor RaiA
MQIQISSDKNISMHSKLSNLIDSDLKRILDRFKDEITRVEVHLSDENGDKSGAQDKRCRLEVRPKRHQSLAVTNDSSDIPTAVTGAGAKMVRLLVSTFGRSEDKNRSLTTRASGEGQNLVLKPEAI